MKKLILYTLATLVLLGCQPKNEPVVEIQSAQFTEQFRPQYHFTPPAKWMNDPNGMVYYQGEYHLFYQYYPDSTVWGPMHWGHAVSTDMMAWKHLPVALNPDELGYIFSGSAVIDWNNTSGLGTADNPSMVAIYTYHNDSLSRTGSIEFQYQGIAHSLDKGRTWTKYDGNPVLQNPGIIDFRDPKVFWDGNSQQWVMILAVKDHVSIYTSADLKSWKFQSDFGENIGGHGGVWECPDLFRLSIDEKESKWVMLVSINPGGPQGGSATQYFVGDFDGSTFTPSDTITRWIDLGADNYAGVTWSDVPVADGRRLFIGWMSNWQYAQVVPTDNWRSAMTLPRELLLKKSTEGYLLQSKPVEEISNYLTTMRVAQTNGTFILENDLALIELTGITDSKLTLELSNAEGEMVVIKITDDEVSFDRSLSGKTAFEPGFGARHSFRNFLNTTDKVQIFVDRSSIELFINDGEMVWTELVFPSVPYDRVRLVEGNANVTISKVRPIWGEG